LHASRQEDHTAEGRLNGEVGLLNQYQQYFREIETLNA
jgi:hypothetical protein